MRALPEHRQPNFLAGPYIDRRAHLREVSNWQAEARGDPHARFLLSRGMTLAVDTDPLRAAFVDHRHPLVQQAADSAMVLLGWFEESRCVLIQIDEAFAAPIEMRFEELRPLASELDAAEAGLLAYARALIHWQKRHRYCGSCGAPNEARRGGHVMRCSNASCGVDCFPRIDPAIIVLVTDGDRALLGRQASWGPNRYSTIAGFVEPGESLEDAVAREVLEETGVTISHCRYHSSQPWPFPSSLMLGYLATAVPGSPAIAGDELEDARWFSREDIRDGRALLPPITSISRRLIMHWLDAESR
jgi:NAD+ diphosphatase